MTISSAVTATTTYAALLWTFLPASPQSPSSGASLSTLASSSASTADSRLPGLDAGDAEAMAGRLFKRYTSTGVKKNHGGAGGAGLALVRFRNDPMGLDNEALLQAWTSSEAVLPVYCFDPRLFGTTHYFCFPKTGGILQISSFIYFFISKVLCFVKVL